MTTRRMSKAQEMELLRNQIHTTQIFMASAMKEIEALNNISKVRKLTKAENAKVEKLLEYVREKNKFLTKATKTIRAFHAPATA